MKNNTNTKVCSRCKEEKQINQFYKNQYICKECHKESNAKYQRKKFQEVFEILSGMDLEEYL